MSLQLQPGDVIVVIGDSITQQSWFATFQTNVTAAYTKAGTVVTTSLATATTHLASASTSPRLAPQNYAPTWINKGIVGNKLADVLARVNADVIAQGATVVITEVGINDGIAGTSHASFQSNAATYLAAVAAGLPGVRQAWVSCLMYGEQWGPDPQAAAVDPYNTDIASAIGTAGGTYVDVRTPQQAYEAANNTPAPGALTGFLSNDVAPGIHPNATGKALYTTAITAVTVMNGTPT